MERVGLTQILVTSTAPVYYLTGQWNVPMERLMALYIDHTGRCVLFGNDMFGFEPGEGFTLVTHNDTEDPVKALAEIVLPGKLGVDKFWPSNFLIGLLEKRGDVTPVLGSGPVDDARMIKDQQEIEALRAASKINDLVVSEMIAAVREGAVESDLATLVEQKFRANGADHSSEGQLVCFGPNGADPHHEPNGTVLKTGDSIVFDIFVPIKRYWCDMTRTVFFQKASDKQKHAYEAVLQANLTAEKLIRPGLAMCEFDRAARSVLEDAGLGKNFTHRLGHGLGLECHEPPDNSSVNQVIARPGMVFSVEPGVYLPGEFGIRIEDLVLVTEDGCEVLNSYTKDLQIIG